MRVTDAERMLQEPHLPRRDRLASLMDLIENSTFNSVVRDISSDGISQGSEEPVEASLTGELDRLTELIQRTQQQVAQPVEVQANP